MGENFFPVVECSSDDHAKNDLAHPPDGDLVDGQASRVTVGVITAAGPFTATVDTGADSIWVGWTEFVEGGGTEFEEEDMLAQSADGSPLAVVGKGKLTFSLWGKKNLPQPSCPNNATTTVGHVAWQQIHSRKAKNVNGL
jgi:hypothetical protein